jgi:putative Ca2+/H+ antiporter (TMEM165/GDT1 family)
VHAFILSLIMILLSELGDKTFFIAAILAMKHPRSVVFFGGASALVVMSILSAAMGHLLPHMINRRWVGIMAGLLFLVFGAKMLMDGWSMSPQESEELDQVEKELDEKRQESLDDAMESGGVQTTFWQEGVKNLLEFLFAPGFMQAFVLVFLAEWGDRSQIATIALAAAQDMYFVTLGTIVGHCMCTGIAVVGGRMLAQRISVRTVTLTGALMFVCFAFVYLSEAVFIESW